MAAGAGVHRREQGEAGWKDQAGAGADDAHQPLLERLPQGLEGVAPELRELVEEEDAEGGETGLARARVRAGGGRGARAAGRRAAPRRPGSGSWSPRSPPAG